MQAVSNNTIISLNGLVLHFDGGRTKAVDGVALDVREGEFVAIVGPSGCGKSSLLNLIGTLDVPTSGEIRFRDQAYSTIRDFSLFRRKNIGFVFQSALLIPTLNALDNVLVSTVGCAAPQGGFTARATQLLSKLSLQDRLDHYPAQMSGGERQRVSIARALINDPDVILADEPTGSLDSANAAHVLDMLQDIRKEKALTIVMVTHDPAISVRADRIVHMRDGKIEYTEGAAA
jgi:putative ABC transport system ATP-binding protein